MKPITTRPRVKQGRVMLRAIVALVDGLKIWLPASAHLDVLKLASNFAANVLRQNEYLMANVHSAVMTPIHALTIVNHVKAGKYITHTIMTIKAHATIVVLILIGVALNCVMEFHAAYVKAQIQAQVQAQALNQVGLGH